MADLVVGAIVVAVVGFAMAYIIRSGKNGIKCVGCPDAKSCSAGRHDGGAVCGGCQGGSCGGGSKASCAGCGCHAEAK